VSLAVLVAGESIADVHYPERDAESFAGVDFAYQQEFWRTNQDLDHASVETSTSKQPMNTVAATPSGRPVETSLKPSQTEEDERTDTESLALSLRDLIKLVQKKNERIMFQDLEWAISRQAVEGAKGTFEPALVANYQHLDTRFRQTVRELVETGFTTPIYEEDTDTQELAVEGLVPTGAQLRLGYSLRSSQDIFDQLAGVDREYKMFLGGTITQPLLKGRGIKVNMAEIRVAETDSNIAFQGYREQLIRVVSEAAEAYWDLHLAQETYRIRDASVGHAEVLLKDNMIRVQTGKMAETEVLEARAGLAVRQSLRSEAKQAIVVATNVVRTLFSSSAADKDIQIVVTDQLEIDKVRSEFHDSLLKAFKLRPDYLSSRKKIEREDIKVVFAKNQRFPQLDLEGSYGLNGLSQRFDESWQELTDGDFPTWTVALKFQLPLAFDMKARSELNAAKKRKWQALLELKAVEVAMANQVNTAIRSVSNAREQVRQNSSAVYFNQRLLEAELERFKAGKSNSRLLLEKEADLLVVKEAELESLVNYKKALLELQRSDGSLLVNQGIEVMEEES
jgi:outer membrane protein TolC